MISQLEDMKRPPDYRDVPSVDEEVKYVSDYVKKHLPGLSSPIQKNFF